jgi:hypothetical protein
VPLVHAPLQYEVPSAKRRHSSQLSTVQVAPRATRQTPSKEEQFSDAHSKSLAQAAPTAASGMQEQSPAEQSKLLQRLPPGHSQVAQ